MRHLQAQTLGHTFALISLSPARHPNPHGDNGRMRINLVTPFAEKDAAKAMGARWDSAKKQWYIVDVADLTPFLRWIPDIEAAAAQAIDNAVLPDQSSGKAPIKRSAGVITKSSLTIARCGCDVRAWDDCPHTAAAP